jgi:hypothetical protein
MDVFFVVGSKSAIMGLNPTNLLRQVLQCYHETTPGFVLSAGRAPFKVPEEDVLTRAHGERLIETMNRMQRGYRAEAELEDREAQLQVLGAELLLLTNTHQDLIRYKMKHLKIVFLENELAEEARWPMWRDWTRREQMRCRWRCVALKRLWMDEFPGRDYEPIWARFLQIKKEMRELIVRVQQLGPVAAGL